MATPILCPKCGADDWRADYYQAVVQGMTITRDAEGDLEYDYKGDEDTYDDGCTENERIFCGECEHVYEDNGTFRLVKDPAIVKDPAKV